MTRTALFISFYFHLSYVSYFLTPSIDIDIGHITATGFPFFHGKTVEEQRKNFLCFQIKEKKKKRALFFQGPLIFSLFFHHSSMEK